MADFGVVGKEQMGFLHRHFRDFRKILLVVANFENFRRKAFTFTDGTLHINDSHELHFDAFVAQAFAMRAPAITAVKREAAGG